MISLILLLLSCTPNASVATPATEFVVVVDTATTEVVFLPSISGIWTEPPNIEICKELPKHTRRAIISELGWWKRQISTDYEYGDVYISTCKDDDVHSGVMRFELADPDVLQKNGWEAYARVIPTDNQFDDGTYEIDHARVYLDNKNGVWIIRHEIGHGFGWDHPPGDHDSHLMNTYVGTNTSGLDEYKAATSRQKKATQN
jgi:hypothetical protein